MTPERWQQVKQIFNSAVRIEPASRPAFLIDACGSDEALRKEVESLIEAHEEDGSFIDSPALEHSTVLADAETSSLRPGQTVGSYVITSTIGRGGMGEVYLSSDKRLNRKVALKILPPSVVKDTERMRRFEQEARAASALNHPNIITIYEIAETNSTLMIATEFVEGVTLRQHLAQSKLSLGQKVNIAIQIADALSAAHAEGIVHRDIKPENIMIRPDGYVKVLDFGLAKLIEPKIASTFTEAPTQIKTGSGVVMGTIGYMSPEQARGQTVDHRSDIFNLGTVIYEMVAGHGPFIGETPSDVFASILKTEPKSLSEVAPSTPAELVSLVDKALKKNREERYLSVKELLSDLRNLKVDLDFKEKADRKLNIESDGKRSEGASLTQVAVARQTSPTVIDRVNKNVVIAGLSIVILLGAVTAIYLLFIRARNPATDVEQTASTNLLRGTQLTAWAGFDCYPALSPDGNSLAYSSDRGGVFEIYIKQLTAGGREVQLTNDGGENFQPAWSPDGRWIAYASKTHGGIWVVPSLGGTAKQISDTGSYPSWSPDGKLIAFQTTGIGDDLGAIASGALLPATIVVVPVEGGETRQVTQVGKPAGGHGSPAWSPDGKRIVFGSYDPVQTDVWMVTLSNGDLKKVAHGYDPVYSPDGKNIYFASFGKALNFGVSRIALSDNGDPVGDPVEIIGSGSGRYKHLTISADGKKLAYGTLVINSNIWQLRLAPKTSEPVGQPVALTRDTSFRNSTALFSPDGSRLAYIVTRVGTLPDIYVMNADGTNQRQVTTNPGYDHRPSWFPDGDQLAYLSERDGAENEMWAVSLKSGRERKLFKVDQDISFPRLSPDGKRILFNSKKSGTTNLWVISVEGGPAKQLTFDKETMGFGCWSPDSKYIAFEMKRGDDNMLAIIPSDGGEVVQLTSGKGQSWPFSFSPDGDKIAFARSRDGYWNVWSFSLSAKEEKQLTNYKKLNAFVRYPSWSPRDDQISFEYAETTGNIYMVDLK